MKVNLPENLKRAVMSKDIAAARSAILTEVRNDRTREEPRALELADLMSKELPGFYEPDNGFCSSLGDLDISDELWTKARSAMMLNFSRERLCFIETIVRELSSRGNNGHHIPVNKSPKVIQEVKSRTCVALACLLAAGIITTGLVIAVPKSVKKNLRPVATVKKSAATVKKQAKDCPTERLAIGLSPTNRPAQVSTNFTSRTDFRKDNR